MCYLIAKKFKQSGCISLKTKFGRELAELSSKLETEVNDDIQIVTNTRPTIYSEYEPYHFVHSYDEFESEIKML